MSEKKIKQTEENKKEKTQGSPPKVPNIYRVSDDILLIEGTRYEIISDHRAGLEVELLKNRYTDIFEKFDYIVGDMSYDQLRLRGFYENETKNVPIDMRISSLQDYLTEYCSFGCAYFVLKRLDEKTVFPNYQKPKRRRKNQKRRSKNDQGKTNKKNPKKSHRKDADVKKTYPNKPKHKKSTKKNFEIRKKKS